MKRLFLLATAICILAVQAISAKGVINCRGIVVDEQGEAVIGATVTVPGTSAGTATDIDGKFVIKVPEKGQVVKFSAVGYKTKEMKASSNLGTVKLETSATMLQDVVITQSVARTRETPIAISEVSAATIDLKLGNQEFPEILKTTPGVWTTRQGGGYGDAKTNMRGFKSENVAVIINGVPINDMEWGGVYWSNWAGLSDVTSSIQTQRGLGAAMLSAPSIGGTINITTYSLDAKRGGNAWFGLGNDGMTQEGVKFSTGLMDNGWAMTVLGSHRKGDGYVQGTEFEAWNYFVNVSKRINDQHQLSLTAFGSPQKHGKRSSGNGLNVEGWQEAKKFMGSESRYKYNPTFGYDKNGKVRSSQMNTYHKPQISLNHIWQINPQSSLSSAVYVSIAQGGGYAGQGRGEYNGEKLSHSSWYGANNGSITTLFRNADGTFAYDKIQEMNEKSLTGSNMIMSQSNNNHEWYGLVSTYRNEILPKQLTVTAGLDVRYYIGHHNNKIIDLYNGEYFMDDSSRRNVNPANNAAAADPNWKYQKLSIGDVVYRDYDGHIAQEGVYGQAEYNILDKKFNFVVAGSLSNTSYWRVDRMYYDEAHATSSTENHLGGTIKGGANWNINRHNNIFVNGGYISRAPFFSQGVFLQSTTSHAINPNPLNEKIGSVEFGYEYHSHVFSATLNGYYTKWMDKTTVRSGEITSGDNAGDRYVFNMSGVDARHMGLELNFTYAPTNWFELQGMLSWGDYIWDNDAEGYFYNMQGQPLTNLRGDLASGILAEDHAHAILRQDGVKVGGSAQTTAAVAVTFRPFKGFRIGADWTCNARNYSDYSISSSSYAPGADIKVADPWEIPWGNQLDLSASYNFKISKDVRATIYGNVNNLCNYNYIMDATTQTGDTGTWNNAYKLFYSFGRTFSVRVKVSF